MHQIRKIKIFIGSSIDELKNERNELVRFISGLCNKYIDSGIYFEPYVCEESSSGMVVGGSQSVHDQYIENQADVALFIFYTKAGKYTCHELELARTTLIREERPDVFIYFKAVNSHVAQTEEIKACVERVTNEYGHFYRLFDSADTIKLELLQYLIDKINNGSVILVQNGKVLINGIPLSDDLIKVENVFAFQNNSFLSEIKERINALHQQITEASRNGNTDKVISLSSELTKVQKEYLQLEEDIFGMLKLFYEENRKREKADPLRQEALRLLEAGKVAEAKALFPLSRISNEAEAAVKKFDISIKLLQSEGGRVIDDAILHIRILKMDYRNPNRFAEICAAYDCIMELARYCKHYDIILEYAHELQRQKLFDKAREQAEYLKDIFDHADEEEVSEEKKIVLLNLLGLIYTDLHLADKAEAVLNEVFSTAKKMETGSHSQRSRELLAAALNNLGLYYTNTGNLSLAERFYYEALCHYRYLAGNIDEKRYIPDVAMVCHNLAVVYMKTIKNAEAEKLLSEAMTIRKKLMDTVDPGLYGTDFAKTCTNLGILYSESGRTKDAGELFLAVEAVWDVLDHWESSASYNADRAHFYSVYAKHCARNGKYSDAISLFQKAVDICLMLSETVSRDAYTPDIAYMYGHMAECCSLNGNIEEAEEKYKKSIELYQQIFNNPEKKLLYEPDLAIIYLSFAKHCIRTGRDGSVSTWLRSAIAVLETRIAQAASAEDTAVYMPVLAEARYVLASYLADMDTEVDCEEAAQLAKEALSLYQQLADTEKRAEYDFNAALCFECLAGISRKQKNNCKAKELYLQQLAIFRALNDSDGNSLLQYNIAVTCYCLAVIYSEDKDYENAERYYFEAVELLRTLYHSDRSNNYASMLVYALSDLADMYSAQGRNKEAVKLYEEAGLISGQ